MVVTRLRLRDFRSYASADVAVGERLTVVHGPNGAGKTNLLEALYFALTARSCRTSNERELVRSGQQVTRVVAEVTDADDSHTLEVGLAPRVRFVARARANRRTASPRAPATARPRPGRGALCATPARP